MGLGSSQKSPSGNIYKNPLTTHYDPTKPQFVPDENEIRALFDVFKRNEKINLAEFLDVLKQTGNLSFNFAS
jgi:Ca2+-binding EF-hand superfamily protein